MRKSNRKPNVYEQMLRQHTSFSEIGVIQSGTPDNVMPFFSTQAQRNPSEFDCNNNIPAHIPTAGSSSSQQTTTEQIEVELLTFSRQIKAEIDAKIVALQLMIADADRVLREWEEYLSLARKYVPLRSSPTEPEQVHIIKSEETDTATNASQNIPEQPNDLPQSRSGDLNTIVVEDPFAVNDFGFDKAMHDLERLASSIPAFETKPSLYAWNTPTKETYSADLQPDAPIGLDPGKQPLSPLSEWDTPMSYPISDYRLEPEQPLGHCQPPAREQSSECWLSPCSPKNKPPHRKSTYTNKLLMQVPPQLGTLLTDEPVRKMGSKPLRIIRQEPNPPVENEPIAQPVIPKLPPPNAQAILVESAPFSQAETGLDKIAVRKAKRHQLQYLIEKGLSPKEIAAHLEMPVGEVELIFSLHKRLSGNAMKTVGQPLTAIPTSCPRIIGAENVVVSDNSTNIATIPGRRFKIIGEHHAGRDDGEQVTG